VAPAATKLLVSVVDQKSAKPVADLQAADFAVVDGEHPRAVESASFASGPVDVLLLVDSSLMGHAVQGAASDLIQQLGGKEQMGLVAYHSSADLVQEFTSSKQALTKALAGIKYGNEPRALDGIYAGIEGAFEHATLRKVVLLLTSGFEGYGKVNERTVVQLARKNGVSIYPLFLSGSNRGMFERLARQTGGVAMNMRDLSRSGANPGVRVFEAIRSNYSVMISGNLPPSEKLKVEIRRTGKYFVSTLALD
jgi:VWFA-related protein